MGKKSSVEEIRRRFDDDVERFSNLQTGQSATIDAPLVLSLVTEAAAHCTPHARDLVDVGCGAGNYALKMVEQLPGLNITLIDLSRPMLDRATARLKNAQSGELLPMQGDIREIELKDHSCDLIVAAAVLHHLRTPEEWALVAQKFYRALRPGGSIWISDLITHDIPGVQKSMWTRYGSYLTELRGESYRDDVFAYIEKEDSPVSLSFQFNQWRSAGFSQIDILHKNGPFAAYGALK